MSEAAAAVTLTNAAGLHARPAVKLTKLAKSFAGAQIEVALAPAGPWIDAKSVVKVMALKAPSGCAVFLRARGEQAAAALAALVGLVERGFDEAHAAAPDAAG